MKVKRASKNGGVVVELSSNESQVPAQAVAVGPAFKIEKVLVPVDFSDCSKKALEYAIPFAKQFGAELNLLHVLEPYPAVPEMAPFDADTIEDAHREMALLQKAVGKKVRTTSTWRNGTPYREIPEAARELGADLIIISTHGHKGLARMVLGSTTEKVVRYAPCPVLIVRETEHDFIPCSSPSASD
jgi:nucleotide-binding universal stress UspA family protein